MTATAVLRLVGPVEDCPSASSGPPLPSPGSRLSRVAAPDVVVVDHHDSYTWNLVHLVAAVTGVLPAVVEHDEVTADEVLAHRHVVLSPGPGTPTKPADFAVGREVLLAGPCRCSASASACRASSRRTAAASAGSSRRTGGGEGRRTTARGVFAGLPSRLRRGALPLARRAARARRAWSRRRRATAGRRVVMGVRHRTLPL